MLLTENKLTGQQEQAIELLVQKFYDGKLTDQKIAEKVGVSRKTLYMWKQKPEFNDELIKQSKEVNRSAMPTGLAWMNRTLNNPRAKDSTKLEIVKLLMKQAGELKDVQESTVTVNQSDHIDSIIADFKALGADTTE